MHCSSTFPCVCLRNYSWALTANTTKQLGIIPNTDTLWPFYFRLLTTSSSLSWIKVARFSNHSLLSIPNIILRKVHTDSEKKGMMFSRLACIPMSQFQISIGDLNFWRFDMTPPKHKSNVLCPKWLFRSWYRFIMSLAFKNCFPSLGVGPKSRHIVKTSGHTNWRERLHVHNCGY